MAYIDVKCVDLHMIIGGLGRPGREFNALFAGGVVDGSRY
jgi:hypothetical protein